MKPLLLSLVTSIILPFLADAMPTVEEQEKVRPLVQGLMKPDLDAMKQGKKSRSDVAKSAMDLYSKADSPAAKMLLARNAFNLYAKAGEYEAAEASLDALLTAVPDYPAPDVVELIEKSLYSLPSRAAPNLRARLAAIKDKAQSATQLKKLLSAYDTLAEGPKRKACAARIASAYAVLDDWPNANKYFAVSDSPAAAAATVELKLLDEPEASRSYDKAADAWWAVELPKKDARLSSAIRSHAAALYAKAIPSLKGLAKVQAERRIAEAESAAGVANAKSDSASSVSVPSAGSAKFTGVKLVGSTVKNTKGVLSDFSNTSFALIDQEFSPGDAPIEAVIDFTMPKGDAGTSGIISGLGQGYSFTPFQISNKSLIAFLSNSGSKWDVARYLDIEISLKQGASYRCKCEWTGSEYIWSIWHGKWVVAKRIQSKLPVAGGLKLAIGVNRGINSPFAGTIDLNKCYLKIGGKLWWEGVMGAHKNANK